MNSTAERDWRLPLPVFVALLAVSHYIRHFSTPLSHFNRRIISEATIQLYDVASRARLGIAGLFLFLAVFFLCRWLIITANRFLKLAPSPEFKGINSLSIVGSLLLPLQVFQCSVWPLLNILFNVQLVLVLVFLMRVKLLKQPKLYGFGLSEIGMLLLALSGLYILLIAAGLKFSFGGFFVITSLLSFYVLFRTKTFSNSQTKSLLFKTLFAFCLVPCLIIITQELNYFLAFHHRSFISNQSALVSITGLSLTGIFVYNYFKRDSSFSSSLLLSYRYLPWFVVGCVALNSYNPLVESTAETFELGNRFLPVSHFVLFNRLPIFDLFNSHLFSEIAGGLIYTAIYGLYGQDFLVFDFLFPIINYVLAYWVLLKFTQNPWVAFGITLVFPFPFLFPGYFGAAPLLVLGLSKLLATKNQTSGIVWFLISITFLCLWRADIAFSAISAIVVIVAILTVSGRITKDFLSPFIKTAAWFGLVLTGLLGVLILFRGLSVFDNLNQAFHYLDSVQAYGHLNVGNSESLQYKMLYFIFPATIGGILLAILLQVKYWQGNSRLFFPMICLLGLGLFYFFNFSRGLVRHGLCEIWDSPLTSYAYFVIPAAISFYGFPKAKNLFFTSFCSLAFVLGFSCKTYSPAEYQSILDTFKAKLGSFSFHNFSSENLSRTIESPEYIQLKESSIVKQVKNILKPDETFYDFTNHPMLYYFAEKETPSYFAQTPLTVIDDYLQEKELIAIKSRKVPICLFPAPPKFDGDNVDGIPNSLRHYKMAEYFFYNYEPFAATDGYLLWKQKGYRLNGEASHDSIFEYPRTFQLNYLPSLWWKNEHTDTSKALTKGISKNDILNPLNQSAEIAASINPADKQKGNYIYFSLRNVLYSPKDSEKTFKLVLNYYSQGKWLGAFQFETKQGKEKEGVLIRASTQANWYLSNADSFSLKLDGEMTPDVMLKVSEFKILKGD